MPSTTIITGPYQVVIEGSGFRSWAGFATTVEAYAEANRVREIAETGQEVAFVNSFGMGGSHLVRRVRILRQNQLTGKEVAHARSWSLSNPSPDALTPLSEEWHGEPLPDDWFV